MTALAGHNFCHFPFLIDIIFSLALDLTSSPKDKRIVFSSRYNIRPYAWPPFSIFSDAPVSPETTRPVQNHWGEMSTSCDVSSSPFHPRSHMYCKPALSREGERELSWEAGLRRPSISSQASLRSSWWGWWWWWWWGWWSWWSMIIDHGDGNGDDDDILNITHWSWGWNWLMLMKTLMSDLLVQKALTKQISEKNPKISDQEQTHFLPRDWGEPHHLHHFHRGSPIVHTDVMQPSSSSLLWSSWSSSPSSKTIPFWWSSNSDRARGGR